jgi:hypothetical protein
MYCQNCGEGQDRASAFCSSCGNRLNPPIKETDSTGIAELLPPSERRRAFPPQNVYQDDEFPADRKFELLTEHEATLWAVCGEPNLAGWDGTNFERWISKVDPKKYRAFTRPSWTGSIIKVLWLPALGWLTGALISAFGARGSPTYWTLSADSWGATSVWGVLSLAIVGLVGLFPTSSSYAKRRWRTQLWGVITWIGISILALVVLAEVALRTFTR